MPNYTVDSIRTVALVGHSGGGKTSLAEALMHVAGALPARGSVERGTTVCDFDSLEQEYQHSLNSALVHFAYGGAEIRLIDTPGYPDFIGHAICALDAVETAVIVINAQNGIELNTQRMMDWAGKRKLCRMIVINRIDAENVNLPELLANVQEAFGKECLPINLPAAGATKVVDCFFNPAGESDFSSVEAAHGALVDQVVEVDEALMSLYLEQGEVSPEQLHAPFEQALRDGHLIPICFTSSRTDAGVKELLEIFARLLPNPIEGNPPLFVKGEGEEAERFRSEPDPKKHVLAHVFKIVMDPFVGKLGIFRVHQGTLTKDTQLLVGEARKAFKVGHLFQLMGKQYVETDVLIPGDFGAVAKVDEVEFDCVLHDSHDEDHIHLKPLEFPTPMYGLAVEPKRRGDEQRISEVLHKLQAEDPCLHIEHHPATHETVMRGPGELHLRALLERMSKQYKLEITTKPPRVPYRETITGHAEGHHRHKKQTGGAGQFGEVFLRVEPTTRSTGFEFVDKVYGGSIPTQYLPAVEKGVRLVLQAGPLAGYPVEDVKVTVFDGKSHPVDSKEVAFVQAGKKAFLDALRKAGPVILEPIVNIEVTCPEDTLGDLTSDLTTKRGRMTGTQHMPPHSVTIRGLVPLAELTDFHARLKSITAGRGSYSMELSHYDPVPFNVQQQMAAQYKGDKDEE
jgi:elongation factor G